MALTDLAIRNAKPAYRPQKMSDGGNLYLLVTSAGGKLWRFRATSSGAALVAREHKRRLAPLEDIIGKLSPSRQQEVSEASEVLEALNRALAASVNKLVS